MQNINKNANIGIQLWNSIQKSTDVFKIKWNIDKMR